MSLRKCQVLISQYVRREVPGDGTVADNQVPSYKETTEHASKAFGTEVSRGRSVTDPRPRSWPCLAAPPHYFSLWFVLLLSVYHRSLSTFMPKVNSPAAAPPSVEAGIKLRAKRTVTRSRRQRCLMLFVPHARTDKPQGYPEALQPSLSPWKEACTQAPNSGLLLVTKPSPKLGLSAGVFR